MKKFFKISSRIILGLIAFVIVLLIGLYFFIQTETFNQWALDFGVGKLNESWNLKNSRLQVESLNGNILKGLTINRGAVIVERDTLINFSYVNLKYDIWGLLRKEIKLDYLIINSPQVNLYKVKNDSNQLVWNFEKLFASEKEQIDTSQSKFDWGIAVNNLKIENATFRTTDKEVSAGNLWKSNIGYSKEFDFNNLFLSNFEMQMNAQYYPDFKNISLVNLSFNSNSILKIHKFSFNAGIDEKDTITTLWNFDLLTDNSHLIFHKLQGKSFSPFDTLAFENFADKKLEADIDIRKFKFSELKFFLSDVDMLDSAVGLKLKAEGKYSDLYVDDLTIQFPETFVNLKGRVKNLQQPDSLYLDVVAKNLLIMPGDVLAVYSLPVIKNYEQVGKINADLEYKGTLNNFFAKFDIKTANAGNAMGEVTLDLEKENYYGNVNTTSLDLGKILNTKSLTSRLNAHADFDGTGFALNKMYANVKYNISASSFGGYSVRSSTGTVNTQGNNIKLNVKLVSSMASAVVAGRVNIANMNNPVYVLKGNVKNLNIAALTKNSEDKSNLNFSFDVNGRGSSLNNINGKFNMNVQNSTYAQYQIPQTPLNIDIQNAGKNSVVSVNTDFMKFNLKGSTNFASISKTIAHNVSTASDAFAKKMGNDSLALTSNQTPFVPSEDFTLDYKINITDSAKANTMFAPFGMKFMGSVNGKISNSSQLFISLTELDAKNFEYQDTVILLDNYAAKLNFENNYSATDNSLAPFTVSIDATGKTGIFQNQTVDSLVMKFNLAQSQGKIDLSARQDSTKKILLKGNLNLADADIKIKIDSLKAHYDKYQVNNFNQWQIDYTPNEKISVQQMAVQSRDAVANVRGEYVFNGSSDLTIEANGLKLSDVFDIIYAVDTTQVIEKAPNPMNGSFNEVFMNFKGDTKNPVITAKIVSDSLIYEDVPFGKLNAALNYENEKADLKINLINAEDNKGTLDITGNIPYANPLSGDTTTRDFSSTPMQVKLNAKDFQIGYFMKFVPSLNNSAGILNGEINADGLVSSPNLTGNMNITNGNIFFTTTGMNYKFDGFFNTSNSKLVVERIIISNLDDQDKHIDVHGNIDFAGMKINDIDLALQGDMVILDKSVDNNDLGVYGYLWGGSGSPAITIKGNLDKLKVAGQFLVKEATISSLPMGGTGYDAETDDFVYIKAYNDSLSGQPKIMADLETYKKLNHFERARYYLKDSSAADKKSFLDLDLNVKTERTIYVSIDFNNITRDRLFGEIQADMKLKTEGNEITANGKIDAIGNSYYRLYRNFKISNSSVTFDGPISDPSINLQAIYTGTKTTQQYGSNTSSEVQVKATISGRVSKPVIELKLLENGGEVGGTDAQSDAITYLLFGKFKNELSTSERQSVASTVGTTFGSNYVSSILSETVRDVLPFLIDAEFNYTEGKAADTDVQLTSEFGDATVKVGGQLFKEVKNFEFVVDYPVNKMMNLNLPETLLLQFYRQDLTNSVAGLNQTSTNTGIKLIYKIRF